MKVGVISDTHGLLRPEAVDALRGVEHILHGGDIGKPEVLEGLGSIAPVIAIRGNNDEGLEWAREIPDVATFELAGRRIHMLHDLKQLAVDPAAENIDVVISGHSHKPVIERREGVLYVNPGSAGPRRFSLPITVVMLELVAEEIHARLMELNVPKKSRTGKKRQ